VRCKPGRLAFLQKPFDNEMLLARSSRSACADRDPGVASLELNPASAPDVHSAVRRGRRDRVVLIYLGIGTPLREAGRWRVILDATLTAGAVGLGFLFAGDAILEFLGVTVGDFQIAGGLLLLVLSIHACFTPTCPCGSRGPPASGWSRSASP